MRVEEIRQARNLTQREFAYLLGVTERTIQFWEHGQTYPSRRHREAIRKKFGMEVDAEVPSG